MEREEIEYLPSVPHPHPHKDPSSRRQVEWSSPQLICTLQEGLLVFKEEKKREQEEVENKKKERENTFFRYQISPWEQ